MKFLGYKRPDGSVGVRNHVLILPSVVCANHIVRKITSKVEGIAPLFHTQGCNQLGKDREQTFRTLVGLGKNPNVAATLIVGLGCEQVDPDELADKISSANKPVESISALDLGGDVKGIDKGVKIAKHLLKYASKIKKSEVKISDLVIGVKCALTDTTSGMSANPAVGNAADIIINKGGTVIFGEAPEIIGAEHILAKRAVNEKVIERIYNITSKMEARVRLMGVDMRGANPSPGNIKLGITTIEEKSLGAILKGGSMPIKGVLEYGEKVNGNGLFIMDGPGRTPEALTGLVASGAVVLIMPTGGGSPGGSPIAPIIKVTGSSKTYKKLKKYMDVDVSSIIEKKETMNDAGKRIYDKIIKVSSGEITKVEKLGYAATNIYNISPHL